jgi:serine/threonine protein kinase
VLLKAVSHGAYGKVCLARKKQTRDLFAIKIMDKKKMEEKGVIEEVINERNILNKVNNNYIVRGVYTFQTAKFLYLVMEYMKGGDFAGLLENIGAFEEDTARMYLAQIVVAIEYLHKTKIIHRDLKPDNILIDSDGFIKLTDFGLSEINLNHIKDQYEKVATKNVNPLLVLDSSDSDDDAPMDLNMVLLGQDSIQKREKAFTNKIKLTQDLENIKNKNISSNTEQKKILGTPDYIAPEVIQGKGVTNGVDWWAVGVIAFEFMTGNLPFNDDSPEKIFENIVSKTIKWPPKIEEALSHDAIDFIKRLMNYDVPTRLGANGAEEVKDHPFFTGIKWDRLDETTPPFIPEVDNEIDTTFFTDSKKFDMKELEDIQNDMNNYTNESFGHFDSTVIDTLAEINKKEAKKAILKASSLSKYKSELQIENPTQSEIDKPEYEFDSLLSSTQ